jgi:hypothetical protein
MTQIYFCRICEREFEEIPHTAVRIGGNSAYKLYRFPCGEIHDVRKIRVGPPEKSEAAIVVPEPRSIEEPVKADIPAVIEQIVSSSVPEAPAPEAQTEEQTQSSPEGEWVDAVCTKYEPHFGDGMLKMEERFRRRGLSPRCWLVFSESDIVSYGQIKIGSRVYCLVDDPDYAGTCPRAREISLYLD